MCLGLPGRVAETFTNGTGVAMGRVSFSGVVKDVCLAYVPEAAVGDYVFVHLGFAINRLDEEDALETMALFEEIEAAAVDGLAPG